MEIKKIKNLILVGGGSRNLGKTEFITQLISHLKAHFEIYALKIKTLYAGDDFFHGKERNPLISDYEITEYQYVTDLEDTSRMLKAGAKKAFKIKTKSENLATAFEAFLEKYNDNEKLIICESNSLRNFYVPAYFFFILGTQNQEIKPSAKKILSFADKIIISNGKNFDINIKDINFTISNGVKKNG